MEIIKPQTSLSSFEVNKIGNEIRPKTDQNLHFSVKFTAGNFSKAAFSSFLLSRPYNIRLCLETDFSLQGKKKKKYAKKEKIC